MQTGTKNSKKESPSYLIPKTYNPNDWEDTVLDKKKYTYNDYKNLPEGAPYQLIRGKLVMTPAPEIYHQRVSRKLGFKLCDFVDKNDLGEVFYAPIDVQFSEIQKN